jgi:hypothetical protein
VSTAESATAMQSNVSIWLPPIERREYC